MRQFLVLLCNITQLFYCKKRINTLLVLGRDFRHKQPPGVAVSDRLGAPPVGIRSVLRSIWMLVFNPNSVRFLKK